MRASAGRLVDECGVFASAPELLSHASGDAPAELCHPFNEYSEADIALFLRTIYRDGCRDNGADVLCLDDAKSHMALRLAHALQATNVLRCARLRLARSAGAMDVRGLVTATALVGRPGWEDFLPHVISGLAWNLLGFCTLPSGRVSQLAVQQAYYFADLIADCPRAILVGVIGAVAGDARCRAVPKAPFTSAAFLRPLLHSEQVREQLAVVDVRQRERFRNMPFSADLRRLAAGGMRFDHPYGVTAFFSLDDDGMSRGAAFFSHATGAWSLSVDASASAADFAILRLTAPAGAGPDLAVTAFLGLVQPDRHDLWVGAPVSGQVRPGGHLDGHVPIRRQLSSRSLCFLPDFQIFGGNIIAFAELRDVAVTGGGAAA